MNPANVDIMKQNKIADDIVRISMPATFSDFLGSSILSGNGQLSSQSMQLQAVFKFWKSKYLITCLCTVIISNYTLLTSTGWLHGITGPSNCWGLSVFTTGM